MRRYGRFSSGKDGAGRGYRVCETFPAGWTETISSSVARASEFLPMEDAAELGEVRLPNPADLKLFAKAFFLHDGELELASVA